MILELTYAMNCYLRHIDPKVNMDRFYVVSITKSLFGGLCLERRWGRSGTYGRKRLELYDDNDTAETVLRELVQKKLRKGYILEAG